MVELKIDKYRYYDPLFESVRIVLDYISNDYSAEYIQGISGAAFKISGGCPSRPTCICDMWTPDFIKYLGYKIKEYPCFDENGTDISDTMIKAVKEQLDGGKPVLVWHAFTNEEWDVVCGYNEITKQFIGRGTYRNSDDYAVESWDRAKTSGVGAFGAIIIEDKLFDINKKEAEIKSIENAVRHARKESEDGIEGIQFYKNWISIYSAKGADRGVADAYCYDVYSSVRFAGVKYLKDIAVNYNDECKNFLQKAADSFESEANALAEARPYLSWNSPWGVDEERSAKLVPILKKAASSYETAVEYLEKVLNTIK